MPILQRVTKELNKMASAITGAGFRAKVQPTTRDRAVKVRIFILRPKSATEPHRPARLTSTGLQVFATAKAKVHFRIQQQVNFGDVHKIVGNTRELGRWKVDKAPEMAWTDGDVWTLDIDVPAETNLEFKVHHVIQCLLHGCLATSGAVAEATLALCCSASK